MAPARPPRAHVPEGPSALDVLLQLIDEAFNRVSWHGPTLLGAVRGVGVDQAAWRPESGRHNIHELGLDRPVKGKQTVAYIVRGIAAPDLSHAGQIQLLKRLSRRESLSFVDAGRDPRAAALPVLRRPRGREGGPVPSRQRS